MFIIVRVRIHAKQKKNTDLSSLQLAIAKGHTDWELDLKGMVFPSGQHQLKPDFDLKI